jgi:hypothetical protein
MLNKGDVRTLIADLRIWTPTSVGTIPAGTAIEIQQVSLDTRKYLVSNVWFPQGIIERAVSDKAEINS